MNNDITDIIHSFPSDQQLDEDEYILDSEVLAEQIEDEDVSFYAELCNDEILDSYMRQYLMNVNDTTNSNSAEECYLKNVIKNKNNLAAIAKRQMEYEHKW